MSHAHTSSMPPKPQQQVNDQSSQITYIPYPNMEIDSMPQGKVNAQNYQVTLLGKPKLTQMVQSEYLLGNGHVNDFNERVNGYAQQMSEELSKQNIIIAIGVNTLNKKLNRWASPKTNNIKRFGKGSAFNKTVKFADQIAKTTKNDSFQDKATKTLSTITSQMQQIKNLIHSTSEEEGNSNDDQIHMFNTTSDSEDNTMIIIVM